MTNIYATGLTCLLMAACSLDEPSAITVHQAPLPQSLELSISPAGGGDPVTFTITGMPPGTRVRLARARDGQEGPGPCPSVLAGDCLDIQGPHGIVVSNRVLIADATGTATWTPTLPTSLPDGLVLAFQAVAPSLLAGSNVVEFEVGAPTDCPIGERFTTPETLCVSGYPDMVPFSEFSLGHSAMCGGTGTTSGYGYPTSVFGEVGFEIDLDEPYAVGDTLHVAFLGWASGVSGVTVSRVDVSTDNQSWVYAGDMPPREFIGNDITDTSDFELPIAGDQLFVRMSSDPTTALIFVRQFEAQVYRTCPLP